MYKVEVDGYTIHDPRDENFILPYAKVDLELNKTGAFEFDITSKNPGYTYVDPMKSIISVCDDGKLIFRGRSTTKESDFYNTGTLKCEGELSYLIDTILRPRSSAFNNQTNRYIFQEVLNEHNSQVNEEKKFLPGIIDVDSETISQISFNYEKPLDFINTNLIEKYGGYIRIRYADGKRYLDWVKQYGKVSKQPIRFGYNLLDLKKTLTSTDVCTVVVPVGGSDKKVTVKNAVVDGNVYGKDYIQNDEAISYFGKIIKVQEFSDIQEPTKLYTEGKKWLEENMKSSLTLELTAIDLHMVDLNIDDFKLGDLVPVISIPHEIVFNDDLPVVEKYSYDITDPSKNTITVGKTLKVFTERKDKEIYERVQEVKGKFEGYVVTNDGKVEEIKENIQEYKALVLQDFTAVNGKIENLSGDFAAFKTGEFEELKAKQAELESVKGDFASFKTGEFESLKSKQAEFETTTTENFTAVNAELESVKGDFASFKTGEFEDLKAKSAELETAVIGKADITDLDALRTRTGTLEADFSKISTLVNGNLTSENIQNLNLTSLNTTIENGMIKNAMIESLMFDKITGIDINTTKMTVHSNDGKSTWTDNTIQIADAKRVRVQIGKDASGDYNIYIWDKDGNLMFDPLYGVQESGIKRAIIRDDMVSDNANIQGSKLDIEDVIKEVNGAETTIKGTRIKLDEQNQTLDMAFSSLKTYAEGVNSKTETNTTAITVAQGQISSLISNTTIIKDGKTVQLKDAYNSTVSDINTMKTTIGEHTSLLDEQSGKILAVQTKANTIESDLNGTKQTISDVQSDLSGTKSRVTTVESGLDGLKTRVSDTETALTKKADGTTVDTLTNRVATCETTLDEFEVSLSETNKTVSDNYTSLADEIEETNATVATHTEQISKHDTRITAAENSISLKVSTSDFNSYKTTVKGDIDTAKNAAINAAASDATTKANNAKSSAINTAAADAKTKADKALADSKSYTNAQVATVNESLSETNQEINVMKGQIALKVEQKDIDTVVQNIDNKFASYSTTAEMNSAINMRADSILSTVEETYTTKSDFDNLEIGGRNLIIRSTETPDRWIDSAGNVVFYSYHCTSDYISILPDTDYVFTKTSSTVIDTGVGGYFRYAWYDADKNYLGRIAKSDNQFIWRSPQNAYFVRISYPFDCKVKFERGNKATDWSPAPEDVDEQINSVKASLELKVNKDTLISEINASADVITLTGNRFIVNSDNFSLTADGTMTANNGIFSGSLNGATGSFSGIITATRGTIGGWNISESGLYDHYEWPYAGPTDTAKKLGNPDVNNYSNVNINSIDGLTVSSHNKCTVIYNDAGQEADGYMFNSVCIDESYGTLRVTTSMYLPDYPTIEDYNYNSLMSINGNGIFFEKYDLDGTFLDYGITSIGQNVISTEVLFVDRGISNNFDALLWDNGTNLWIGAEQLAGQEFYSGSISIACGGNIDFYSSYASSWSARINDAYGYCAQGEKGLYSTTMGKFVARYFVTDSNVKCTAIGNNNYPTRIYGKTVWANTSISTSDVRYKEDFHSLDAYEKMFMYLEPITFKWKKNYEENDDRIHFGLKAQQVEEAFAKAGFDVKNYSIVEDYGMEKGLCYNDLLPTTIHMTQKNTKELMYQAGKIDLHETIIQDLQNQVYQLKKQVKELKQAVG